jgi:hypothetical protein
MLETASLQLCSLETTLLYAALLYPSNSSPKNTDSIYDCSPPLEGATTLKSNPLCSKAYTSDHYNSEFFPQIEAVVTHEIVLPTSSSTRCSYPTEFHTRLPANTLNPGYSFTRSSYSTQSYSLC